MRTFAYLVPVLALLVADGCQRLDTGEFPFEEDDGSGDGDGDGDGDSDGDGSGDGGGNEPTYHCNPTKEDGCPDGQKCTAIESNGKQNLYECVDDTPEFGPYDECVPKPINGNDGCPPTYICLPKDYGSGSGLCVPMCKGDIDCDLALCIGQVFTKVKYCSDHCDPTLPMCGSTDLDCLHTVDRFTCKFATDDDDGSTGEPCDGIGDRGCAEGFVCLQGEIVPGCAAGFCCSQVCDLEEPDPCESPATCNPLEDAPPPGFEGIGACFVPF